VGDHDPAFQHHLFDLAEAQWEAVVQPHTMTDDLRREAEPHIRRRADNHQPQPQPLPALSNQSIISATASSIKLTMPAAAFFQSVG
jgi:hypothetical protein